MRLLCRITTQFLKNNFYSKRQSVLTCSSLFAPKRLLTTSTVLKDLNGNEFRIPTPYGHIAAVEYGDPNGHPVLAVHGWKDNVGSFEPLLPHIIEHNNLHVIAIDETGCGHSSHMPRGSQYPMFAPLKDMRRVINFLEWKNFSILGHSRGAGFSFYYAAFFPESVQCFISIDFFGSYFTKELCPFYKQEASNIDKILKFEQSGNGSSENRRIYTEEEAIKSLMKATDFALTEKSAQILMKRGTKPQNGGVVFTRDSKQNLPYLDPLHSKVEYLELMSKVKCDVLIIMASKGMFSTYDNKDLFNVLQQNCRSFKQVRMEGDHFLHMDIPEQVASHINPFFEQSIQKGAITNLVFAL
ncbi:serine hydrolase-like protein [Leptotrombidium deliense]|uniref:Serine hydrolase-like protein n=1 Tax=Leptotrombidium deliense TaxID=299467 RepID=A0A443SKJ0_9ACAR|nr:serine hydrolase-like protein [Leptotrombidium deliense]